MNETQPHGILAIWHDMVQEHEQEVNDWYNHEHHSERVGIPGFFNARRHIALEGKPKYFVFYETTDPSVLETDAYLSCVNNPSPWTQRTMPHYRNTNRLVCRRETSLGHGHGACVMTIRFNRADAEKVSGNADLIARAEAALQEPGIVSVQIWKTDPQRTDLPTKEKEIRGEPDGTADGIIMMSANLEDQVRRAGAKHFDTTALQNDGIVDGPTDVGLYQLIFTLGG